MTDTNTHGLSRTIPNKIKREIRQRSKFGCVICRDGFVIYEHIRPEFRDATSHDPNFMCCLCGSCHDKVTKGIFSKEYVESQYRKVQNAADVLPPRGVLDFHDGRAVLLVGGLEYSPAVRVVVKYHGLDLVRVEPGSMNEPGRISAFFTDSQGKVILQLKDNEWIGSLENWDIDSEGGVLTIRRKLGDVALKLRLEPPGKIVVERLDMRFRSAHILATETTYAVGRYITEDMIRWFHADVFISKSSASGAAIEFTDCEALKVRSEYLPLETTELATPDRAIVINSLGGVMNIPLGIAIASMTGSFGTSGVYSSIDRSLADTRRSLFNHPDTITGFMVGG